MNSKGKQGEDWAHQFLVHQGLVIIRRNYPCRWGEIDIIARQGYHWVFVEVRWRQRPCPSLIESIDQTKQRRWQRTAQHYLTHAKISPPCRFDVLLLEGREFFCTTWLKGIELSEGFNHENY